ncbi:MAG: membrane protein insertase YidC [Brevinematales bacterium]|nr:membrane protein insertase YidC [Brevinematales bacterium]
MASDRGYEKRMLIAFIVSFVLLAVTFLILPKNQPAPEQQTNAVAALGVTNIPASQKITPDNLSQAAAKKFTDLKINKNVVPTVTSISNGNELKLTIDTYGALMKNVEVNGTWNRYTNAVSLVSSNQIGRTSDLFFGNSEYMLSDYGRPVYTITAQTSNSITLAAETFFGDSKIFISRTYTVLSNYQYVEEISFKNASGKPVTFDKNQKGFTLMTGYEFFPKTQAAGRNQEKAILYDGKDKKEALVAGLFQPKKLIDIYDRPSWVALHDNYFITITKPDTQDFSVKYLVLSLPGAGEKPVEEMSMSLEYPVFVLNAGETKTVRLIHYTGPMKEDILTKWDASFGMLFDWGPVFNWLMKPIEWVISNGLHLFAGFIGNYGVVIILLAFIIKLLLSPLSVKAAISIKRMNMLQPKIKNLQEKFKDDPQRLQVKMAELYKQEKVNPLGGCWPMLLQIPVFFALFRVLSNSVELRGAVFLWIRDLTQPDTLFTMSIPLLPAEFNLLPIIMTAIQLLQTKLQSANNPTMQQQGKLTTYLLPIVFLFLFWSMPAGLVLYWTVQNIFTIAEQYFINFDKAVKLPV